MAAVLVLQHYDMHILQKHNLTVQLTSLLLAAVMGVDIWRFLSSNCIDCESSQNTRLL
jgi:hypothetical protein